MNPDHDSLHETLEYELPAFLAGELAPEQMLVVARALEHDAELRRTLVEVAEMVAVLQDAAGIPVAPDRIVDSGAADVPINEYPGDARFEAFDMAALMRLADEAGPAVGDAVDDDSVGGFASGGGTEFSSGPELAGPERAAGSGTFGFEREIFAAPSADEVAAQRQAATGIRRRNRRQWWEGAVSGVAAALVLVLGVTLGLTVLRTPGGSTTPSTAPAPQVALAPIGPGVSASGAAHMDGHDDGQMMVVNVKGLAPAPSGHHYVVWLVKSDGSGTPLPVGTIGPDGGRFTLPANVATGYDTIDVSLEATGTSAGYSGDSILRGKLA